MRGGGRDFRGPIPNSRIIRTGLTLSQFVDNVSSMDITTPPQNQIQTPKPSEKRGSILSRIYEAIQSAPGREWRMADLERALPDLDRRHIHAALMRMGRTPDSYPGLHRIARGVYVFDPSRSERVWVSPATHARSEVVPRETNGKTSPEVKAPTGLHPSEAIVMEDSAGNHYLLTPLEA